MTGGRPERAARELAASHGFASMPAASRVPRSLRIQHVPLLASSVRGSASQRPARVGITGAREGVAGLGDATHGGRSRSPWDGVGAGQAASASAIGVGADWPASIATPSAARTTRSGASGAGGEVEPASPPQASGSSDARPPDVAMLRRCTRARPRASTCWSAAALVITVDAERRIFLDGAVRRSTAGRSSPSGGQPTERGTATRGRGVIDAGGGAVTPGIHRRPHPRLAAPGSRLDPRHVARGARARSVASRTGRTCTPEDDDASTMLACLEMVRNGTTAFSDLGGQFEVERKGAIVERDAACAAAIRDRVGPAAATPSRDRRHRRGPARPRAGGRGAARSAARRRGHGRRRHSGHGHGQGRADRGAKALATGTA